MYKKIKCWPSYDGSHGSKNRKFCVFPCNLNAAARPGRESALACTVPSGGLSRLTWRLHFKRERDLPSVIGQSTNMEHGISKTGDAKLDQAVNQWLQYDKV